jgi:hypothetical protein
MADANPNPTEAATAVEAQPIVGLLFWILNALQPGATEDKKPAAAWACKALLEKHLGFKSLEMGPLPAGHPGNLMQSRGGPPPPPQGLVFWILNAFQPGATKDDTLAAAWACKLLLEAHLGFDKLEMAALPLGHPADKIMNTDGGPPHPPGAQAPKAELGTS